MTVDRFLESSTTIPLGKVELHPQLLRETQAQLQRDIHDLTLLTRSGLSPTDFYRQFLAKCVEAMVATGAAVWEQSLDGEEWRRIASHQLPIALLHSTDSEETLPSIPHLAVLERVATDPQPVAVPPALASQSLSMQESASGGVKAVAQMESRLGPPDNPTDHVLLLAPITASPRTRLWLQIVQRPNGGPATQRGYLRFAVQMAELIADFLRSNRLSQLEKSETLIEATQRLVERLSHPRSESVQYRDVAETLRGLLGAEQVFLLYRDHPASRRWKMAAASGLDNVDVRSHGYANLTHLADHCLQHLGQMESQGLQSLHPGLWFDSQYANEHAQPPVVEFIKQFQASRMVCLPLTHPNRPMAESSALAITYWTKQNIESCPGTDPHQIDKWTQLLRMGAGIIAPHWWRARPSTDEVRSIWFRLRRGHKWALAACLLGIIACIPIPTSIRANAILKPRNLQDLYAPDASLVREVLVEYGQLVESGQVLLRLENRNLSRDHDEAVLAYNLLARRLREYQLELLKPTPLEASRREFLEREFQSLTAEMDVQAKRIDLLRESKEMLEIRAPFRGMVGTWDPERLLKGRSVAPGQHLLTLYQPDGPWIAEAEIDEESMARLLPSAGGAAPVQSKPLVAKCRLVNHPTATVEGKLEQLELVGRLEAESLAGSVQEPTWMRSASATSASTQPSHTYRARFLLNADQLPWKAHGASIHMRLEQPRAPLAWALTRDLLRNGWIKLQMWL